MTQRANSGRRILRAYVDETGDRGCSPTSSPYFAFACVLVADEDDAALRAVVDKLRVDFGVTGGVLHWKDHIKKFERRQHARTMLAALDLRVVYVLVEKAAIPPGSGMLTDTAVFYNYAAGFVVERAVLTAKEWPGGPRDVVVRFAHVAGFDHNLTHDYIDIKKAQGPGWMPWHLLSGGRIIVEGQGLRDGLQAADAYAGMLHAALRRDPFGGYEPHHFLDVRHQLRRRPGKPTAWACGFKFLGNEATLTSLPWWPPEGL